MNAAVTALECVVRESPEEAGRFVGAILETTPDYVLLKAQVGVLYWHPGTYAFGQHRLRWAESVKALTMEGET